MTPLSRLAVIACLVCAVAAFGDEKPKGEATGTAKSSDPEVEAVELVKGFKVTGTLTKVIGSFSTYGIPSAGNSFELDLSNLPHEMIKFERHPTDPDGRSDKSPSYIPFSAPLIIERVRREVPVTKPGRAAINLSAVDRETKFLIQVQADQLEKGSKVRVFFYKGNSRFMGSMAEAEGVLK